MAKILLRGKPGIGKTTLIKKIVAELEKRKEKVFGFYTEEMREKGERVGFKIVGLTEGEGVMAHTNFSSPYSVSKYKLNLAEFERIAIPEIEKGLREKGMIIIDEIGKLELFSERFKRLVLEIFKSERSILATIPITPIPFIKNLIKISGVKVIEITLANRERLGKEWKDWYPG